MKSASLGVGFEVSKSPTILILFCFLLAVQGVSASLAIQTTMPVASTLLFLDSNPWNHNPQQTLSSVNCIGHSVFLSNGTVINVVPIVPEQKQLLR